MNRSLRFFTFLVLCGIAAGQPPADVAPEQNLPPDKHIFGVIPNYRTADGSLPYRSISVRQKFTIAAKDSFDWPVYLTSAAFAGLYQLDNQNPTFGQGMKGYGRRFAAAYGDQVIGNMMTEGVIPSLLHEDPRYFRRGRGGTWSRVSYALTRVLVTRTDSGGARLNFSELIGNSSAVAISNAYYSRDTRNAADAAEKLGVQVATDAFANVLKEFWPDIKSKLFRKRER
jgi:hypothetical protein